MPNGDFEEIAQTISVTDMNQGGKYSVWPVNYQNTCSFTIQEPTGWASVNAKTCNLSAANQNSWFVIPSTYNTTLTWDAYRSFGMSTVTPDLYRDLTAQSGSNAMVVRNVAWDENGTTPGTSGGAFNTTYYNTNVPNIANRSAGKLFLGSYSYSGGSETYTEGVSFASRPSALKGWYKYANDGNDPTETGVVTVTLLNGQKVIATGTARLSAAAHPPPFSLHRVLGARHLFGNQSEGYHAAHHDYLVEPRLLQPERRECGHKDFGLERPVRIGLARCNPYHRQLNFHL